MIFKRAFSRARHRSPTGSRPWLLGLSVLQDSASAPSRRRSLISYGPGAGIGWHKDRPVFEHVVGISLGAEATMRFRRRRHDKFDRFALPLAPRSIYHLAGEARRGWEHSIAPIEEARWSITFRSLAR